jgi:hypothetical protein
MIRASLNMNPVMLREELSRLGQKDKTDADAAIATLEEQLDSVQKSLDKMVLDNHVSHSSCSICSNHSGHLSKHALLHLWI